MKQIESGIQRAFIQWVRIAEKQDWRLRLLFAVPNGGARTALTGSIMKAEGTRSGVPDAILPVPVGEYTGLAIEFKRPKGKTTPAQDEFITGLLLAGWQVKICYCAASAIEVVRDYLKGE